MADILRKYLLSSVAFAANDGTGAGTPDDTIEVDLEDDEGSGDPEGEGDTEGTEGEDEGGADEDAQPEPGQAAGERQPSRGDRRIQSLVAREKQLAADNARITRELDELRRSQHAPTYQPPAETPQQRAERLSLLSPEDRIRTEVDERLQQHERNQQQLLGRLQDSSDQTAFQALCARNPLAAKMSEQVERELAGVRSRGMDLPRQSIFTYLVGQKALEQMGKGNRAARRNQQRQQGRPVNARGDVRPERQRAATGTAEDFERKFGDVSI